MATSVEQYKHLLSIGKELLAKTDSDCVLASAMDHLIEVTGAERGIIILFNGNGEVLFETARKLNNEEIKHPELEVSRQIINKVKTRGTAICVTDALKDPTLRESDSTLRLNILSVICLPLKYKGKIFGVVYLDNRSIKDKFNPQTVLFIKSFVDFITVAAYCPFQRMQRQNRLSAREEELRKNYKFENIIGHHSKIIKIMKLISQVADTDATVLIEGESGTGKELIAAALHENSSRRDKPFVPVNCAAIPESLLESELFGHVKGAFTGAIKDTVGWFERADGGTIFLDEVSEMSLALQVKLLRVLQSGEYSRVGSSESLHTDARIIAATSANLKELVNQGKFRDDTFYRLNVIDISVPPLRGRKSDILLLAQHFLCNYGSKYNKINLRLSREVETLLQTYPFPGNVRELENTIERTVVLAEGQIIEAKHLPMCVCREKIALTLAGKPLTFMSAKQYAVEKFEREYICDCLNTTKGNISRAARTAGIDVKNFYAKMRKYEIDPHSFKRVVVN